MPMTKDVRELKDRLPPGWAIVPLVPTPYMLAATLPDTSEPTLNEKRLGAEAFSLASPSSDYRLQDGVTAGAELARDWRNMVAAVLSDPAYQ